MPLFDIYLVGVLLNQWEYLQAIKFFGALSIHRKQFSVEIELLQLEIEEYLRHSSQLRKCDNARAKMVCSRLGPPNTLYVKSVIEAE